MVIGTTGSGKSALCNFLSCSNTAFEARCGFARVTEKSTAAIITIQGKRVKLIDTPGFCDDFETGDIDEALVIASFGVNGIGLVIHALALYDTNFSSDIEYLSQFQDLWPYVFIIFTHARALGVTEEDQNKRLQSKFTKLRFPKVMKDLMQKVDNRYILVESIKPSDDPEDYYQRKTKELETMISSINEANGFKLYTNNSAKVLLHKTMKEKDEAAEKLKMIKSQMNETIEKRMEDEKVQQKAKLQVQKATEKQKESEIETTERRKSFSSSTKDEVKWKEKEKDEVKKELDKQYLEKQQQKKMAEDEEKRRINQQAIENIKKQIEEERKQHKALNKELKENPTKNGTNL